MAHDPRVETIEIRAVRVSEWQLIETAPKDGRLVLVWGARRGRPTTFCVRVVLFSTGYWWDGDGYDIDATHWMPLPTPPSN
jgi:hypothetical protein